jgi:hypothetical protein
MLKVFVSNPKVKGSILVSGVGCGQQWYVDIIFSYLIFRIGAYVNYMAYVPRLGFKTR